MELPLANPFADPPGPEPDKVRIQQAHDMIEMVVLGELPLPPGWDLEPLKECLNVLCWVLGHQNVPTFPDNLFKLDVYLRAQGFVMRDFNTGRPAPPFERPPGAEPDPPDPI